MSGLIFLLVALGLSVVGSFVLWLRYRKPTSLNDTIESFQKEMEALAPERRAQGPRPERRGHKR